MKLERWIGLVLVVVPLAGGCGLFPFAGLDGQGLLDDWGPVPDDGSGDFDAWDTDFEDWDGDFDGWEDFDDWDDDFDDWDADPDDWDTDPGDWDTGLDDWPPVPDDFQCGDEQEVPCIAQHALHWIRRASDVIPQLWGGQYRFDTWPLYIVDVTGSDSPQGYLVNPPSVPAEARRVTGEAAQGLTVYRYDDRATQASRTDNDLFDFFFDVDGAEYSMMLIDDWGAATLENGSGDWIMTLVHETFHAYQITTWRDPAGYIQDEQGYPITTDIVALGLLETKIVSAAYKTTDREDTERYLRMFVAARTEKMRVDPSPQQLVRYMDNPQEHGEGSARYIEVKMMEVFDPEFPARLFELYVDMTLEWGFESAADVRDYFAFGMWYETGAIVLRMMDTLGIDYVDALAAGQTPYDIAADHFSMSDAQLGAALGDAQTEFDWSGIQSEAQRYAALR